MIGLNFRQATKTVWRLARKGNFVEIAQRAFTFIKLNLPEKQLRIDFEDAVVIMSPPHTLFHADNLVRAFRRHGIEAVVDSRQNQSSFNSHLYIVIAPQYFSALPPGQKRIIYQVEQLSNSRFATPKYFRDLENSYAIFEYSAWNFETLGKHGIAFPHVYFLPFSGNAEKYELNSKENDSKDPKAVLYGDFWSSERRKELLDLVDSRPDWFLVNNKFGSELQEALGLSNFVVNYHYFENAILETPRIYEALSLGHEVISETSTDLEEHASLRKIVHFIESSTNAEEFVAQVELVMASSQSTDKILVREALLESEKTFNYYFDRFLLALGLIDEVKFLEFNPISIQDQSTNCLSLKETFERRNYAQAHAPQDTFFVEGLRARPGWVGCALSYKAIAISALRNNAERICVFEDDVVLPLDFDKKIASIHSYLDSIRGEWDVYVGLIADLHPDVEVSRLDVYDGIEFVTLNKMTSMVFNIYNKRALELISSWGTDRRNVNRSTIDRFLESQANLKIVTSLDIEFGHRVSAASTLWSFENDAYVDLVQHSRARLKALVESYKYKKNKL